MTSEKTNLADIIEEVKTNLYDIIEEKNALILSENLPSLYVEPVQFYQLFSNLVDNSIKYSRKNIQPVIIISGKLLENCNLKKDAPPLITGKSPILITVLDSIPVTVKKYLKYSIACTVKVNILVPASGWPFVKKLSKIIME
jgi:signal transduction histidine kinase